MHLSAYICHSLIGDTRNTFSCITYDIGKALIYVSFKGRIKLSSKLIIMSNESTNSTTNRGGGEGEVIPETNLHLDTCFVFTSRGLDGRGHFET